jgi:hypothetical protein
MDRGQRPQPPERREENEMNKIEMLIREYRSGYYQKERYVEKARVLGYTTEEALRFIA